MNKEERIKQLECEISELENELSLVSQWGDEIRALSSFTDTEKADWFDALHKQATSYVKTLAETGYSPKDGSHYLFESVMIACLGNGVWDVINSLVR